MMSLAPAIRYNYHRIGDVDWPTGTLLMLVTARAEYACIAMMELAVRHGDPKPVRLAEVTEKHDIPQRFLVQILLQMKAAGLVNTTRGSAGGYQLARRPDEINLADIFGVLDRMDDAEERSSSLSPYANSLNKVWKGLANSRTEYLSRFTLKDLLSEQSGSDYVI